MSIVMERNNEIGRSGFDHRISCIPIYGFDDEETCSSSSIGRNSDVSGGSSAGGDDEEEVESQFKGALESLQAIEEVLPIKRGISTFYNGKSKSFTSLADVSSCSSIKDIAKEENAYNRKRKNLLAHTIFLDKNRGGLPKRHAKSSKSTMALADSTTSSESNSSLNSSSPSLRLPPLPPQSRKSQPVDESSPSSSVSPPLRNFATWRSFSLPDLQDAASTTPTITGSLINNVIKEDES